MIAGMSNGPAQTFKAKEDWTYWMGTPSSVAAIAEAAFELVSQDGVPARLQLDVSAPALDASFTTVDEIRAGLTFDVLADASSLDLDVSDTPAAPQEARPRRIAVAISPPPPPETNTLRIGKARPPVVKLRVAGGDRDWVDRARLCVKERIDAGQRRTRGAVDLSILLVLVALVGSVASVAIGGDGKEGLNAAEILSVTFACLAGLMAIAALSLPVVAPQLELLPDGGMSKWERLRRLLTFNAAWLARVVVAALVGAGALYLIQRVF